RGGGAEQAHAGTARCDRGVVSSNDRISPKASGALMADVDKRGLYVISVAAELAGVHPQTLRIYERRGLLDPARTGGGSRRYSERDIERLRRIQHLTGAGLNLAGVKLVMEMEEELLRLWRELDRTLRCA